MNEQINIIEQKKNKLKASLQVIEKANNNISKIDVEIEKILQVYLY